MRQVLKGLRVEEFIHPDELENKKRALSNGAVQSALEKAANLCSDIVEPLTQGTFVRVNRSSAPELIAIVKDVCRILDVERVPDVYICHLMSIAVTPYGAEQPYLVVPDYLMRFTDEEMLYYNIGNAITMIKADHVELTTLAAYMPGGLFIDAAKILFLLYLHSADATSDRGGLLACQSFAAAARQQFWELGITPRESRDLFTTDREAEVFVENYLAQYNVTVKNFNALHTRAARTLQRLSYIEAPANLMLQDLFQWYRAEDGYAAVLARHS